MNKKTAADEIDQAVREILLELLLEQSQSRKGVIMKIWQIEIGTEELGSGVQVINGLAETAREAIEKAMLYAEKKFKYEKPYPAKVTDIGDQDF